MSDEGGVAVEKPAKWLLSRYLISIAASIILFQSVFLSILTPCPQIFCYLRLGRWAGISISVLLAMLFSAVAPKLGLAYFLQFGLLGILISEAILRKYSVVKSFTLTVSIITGLVLFVLGYLSSLENISTGDAVKIFSERVIAKSLSFNEKAGLSTVDVKEMQDLAPAFADMMSTLYPSLIVVAIMVSLWLNIMVIGRVMKRIGGQVPFEKLSSWKAPEQLVWGVIFGGVALILPIDSFREIGINVLVILFVIYFFQGMAIVSFYLNKRKAPGLVKGVGYLIAIRFLAILVAVLGLFDMWADFRKLSAPKKTEA